MNATAQHDRLLDWLDGSAATRSSVHFDRQRHELAELWSAGPCSASVLAAGTDRDAPLAMVLTATPECVAALLGAWRTGRTVVSVPLPGRGEHPDRYAGLIRHILDTTGATRVAAEPAVVELATTFAVPTVAYPDLGTGAAPAPDSSGGRLVQFSSGSTSAPKGVAVTLDAIAANVDAVLTVIDPPVGAVAVSWLPLSHDMGLIGMVVASLCAGRPEVVDGVELHLLRPEQFLAAPQLWLDRCAEAHTTITAAPNFALDVAVKAAARHTAGRLEDLRCVIVGGEMLRPDALARFAATFADAGFDRDALCPAYGLAEATLAVTLSQPGTPWTAATTAAGQVVVGSGPPLPGVHVTCGGTNGNGPGRVTVDGPSLLSGYLGADAHHGPFTTTDEGFLADGQLHVTGRVDNVMVVAGRNVCAADVEAHLEEVSGLRAGCTAVWQDHTTGSIYAAFEPAVGAAPDVTDLARRVSVVVAANAARPVEVIALQPGTLLKTSSGKTRRQAIASALAAGELTVIGRRDG